MASHIKFGLIRQECVVLLKGVHDRFFTLFSLTLKNPKVLCGMFTTWTQAHFPWFQIQR